MGNLYNSPFESQFDPDRAQLFIIAQLLRGVHTCDLVKVLAVRPTGGKVGFVDVQPMTLETDTNKVVLEQAPIFNVPYMRLQGGASAVKLDPAVGDIGLAMFAERDITNIKQTAAAAAPATDRTFSTADALYIGGVLNPDPTQYVEFLPGAGGINIVSPATISVQTPGNVHFTAAQVVFDADVIFNKNVSSTKTGAGVNTFAAPIAAPDAIINGVTQSTHQHGGVTTGSGNTTGPHN